MTAPLETLRGSRWFRPAVATILALAVFAGVVVIAKVIRGTEAGQDFLLEFPGERELPDGSPSGSPAWLAWQHFLNVFFLLLIIRTGWQVRTNTRPSMFWTPKKKRSGGAANSPPVRISLTLWAHLSFDALWLLNGGAFIALLFTTGQWMRIVPTSWEVFPNALSAALQYASLQWPTENGWINYNSLQLLAYFATVFIAAPLAFLSGIRMSPVWPKGRARLDRLYPMEFARRIHFPVMIYFVGFVIVHVTLVLATGALRNLNHMYAVRNDESWWGFGIFATSVVVCVAAWFGLRPLVLRAIASLTGTVSR